MYCKAQLLAPIASHPNHKIWKCADKAKAVKAGHRISIGPGIKPQYLAPKGAGQIVPATQGGFKFGGFDAKGTRHFYWLLAPDSSEFDHFAKAYETGHNRSIKNTGGSGFICTGGVGSTSAARLFAPDDIPEDKGRAQKGLAAIKKRGKRILASWEFVPDMDQGGRIASWKAGTMHCSVVLDKAALSDSIIAQDKQAKVWTYSTINVLAAAPAPPRKKSGREIQCEKANACCAWLATHEPKLLTKCPAFAVQMKNRPSEYCARYFDLFRRASKELQVKGKNPPRACKFDREP